MKATIENLEILALEMFINRKLFEFIMTVTFIMDLCVDKQGLQNSFM